MDAAPAVRLYLDEVIAPNRSLPRQGFIVLISLVIAVNLLVGTMFVLMGAAPIPIFLGLDVLAVVVAFRVSYAQARLHERVQVTADQVRVLRDTRGGPRTVWTSPTAFTRVDLDRTGRHGAQVQLRLSGRSLAIAKALGPKERAALADALGEAIRLARTERHPT
jgi:uncharacterized membrane protein